VKSIGSDAFSYCSKLVEVYNLSSLAITKGSSGYGGVGYYALNVYTPKKGASKLWTDADGYLFYESGDVCYLVGYNGSDTVLTLPESCHGKNYAIYKYAFYDCDSLTRIEIPASVTSIGSSAFEDCDSLTRIEIPASVTSIGDEAFSGCSTLTRIEIPASVTSIGYSAFGGCNSLTRVYYGGTASEWGEISIDYLSNDDLTSATRYYYSKTEPTTSGNYWHYDEDGKPTTW